MYTAVVIFPKDRIRLLDAMNDKVPPWWDFIGDHMTINMGTAAEGPCAGRVGEKASLTIRGFATDDRVAAVKVETEIPSINEIKHITIAVDRDNGGKPVHSNKLVDWVEIPEFVIEGEITEVG